MPSNGEAKLRGPRPQRRVMEAAELAGEKAAARRGGHLGRVPALTMGHLGAHVTALRSTLELTGHLLPLELRRAHEQWLAVAEAAIAERAKVRPGSGRPRTLVRVTWPGGRTEDMTLADAAERLGRTYGTLKVYLSRDKGATRLPCTDTNGHPAHIGLARIVH